MKKKMILNLQMRFGIYRIIEQRRLRRVCQSFRGSYTQSKDKDEEANQELDL